MGKREKGRMGGALVVERITIRSALSDGGIHE